MGKKYILALDAGTSSVRAILFDRDGQVVSTARKEIRQFFPEPGYVEEDGSEIWSSQLGVAVEAMSRVGVSGAGLNSIGIANQRETTLLWDRQSGDPVAPAIVWQCRRTAPLMAKMKRDGLEQFVSERTGLVLDAYFSAGKLRFLLDESPALRARAAAGTLCFGTVDSWLIYKLTGGRVHATDLTNASRTMLFNIHTLSWDEELLRLFDIPAAILPEVLPSSSLFGKTEQRFFGAPVAITGVAGDQQAALAGQRCFLPGDAKNTYGTGCFLLMNTGSVAVKSENGLLTTIACGIDGRVTYALEGSVFTAGSAIQWLRDGLGLIPDAAATSELACSVSDTAGCYVVPAFTGLGAPYWNAGARGSVFGLSGKTTRAHFVRAVLESLAYQTVDLLEAMQKDSRLSTGLLRVDGGAAENEFLLQFQADLLGRPIVRAGNIEATALGAALLAGFFTGYFDKKNLPPAGKERRFIPKLDANKREALLAGWKRAVRAALAWVDS